MSELEKAVAAVEAARADEDGAISTDERLERLEHALGLALARIASWTSWIRDIAYMRRDGEDDGNGESYVIENDDAWETVMGLISEARSFLSLPDDLYPLDEEDSVTTGTPGPWGSVAEIKAANRGPLGKYFFSADTIKFFDSIVYEDTLIGGRYFITSEKGDWEGAERLFTVRVADDSGDVETAGTFQEHHTKAAAIAAAIRLAAGRNG